MLAEIHVPKALLNQKSGQQMLGSVFEDTPGGSPTPLNQELLTWELPEEAVLISQVSEKHRSGVKF